MILGPIPPPVSQFLLEDNFTDGKEIFNSHQHQTVQKDVCDLHKAISISSSGTPGLTSAPQEPAQAAYQLLSHSPGHGMSLVLRSQKLPSSSHIN